MPQPQLKMIREPQPAGHEGVKFSVAKMIELINKNRLDPQVIAFARRACRDAGILGPDNQDPVKIYRAIFDKIKAQGIGWVPDPVKSEFLAAPRHFIPSGEGKDDALFVAGDCDELSMLQGCLGLCALGAVGVEVSGLVLHSYNGSRSFQHVLGAVYDGGGGNWIRVDHSGDFKFGEFKQPTYEALISLPSGRVICTSERCDRTPPAQSLGRGDWDHGRLEGLPSGGSSVVVGTLGEIAGDDSALREAYGQVLEGNILSLADAMEGYAAARESLGKTFDRLELDEAQRQKYWPPENDQRGNEVMAAAELAGQYLEETRIGMRPWAIDDSGDFAIGKESGDTLAISSAGALVSVLQGINTAPPSLGVAPAAAAAAAPLSPGLIAALAVGGIVLTLGAYAVIMFSLSQLTEMCKIAEVRAANDAVRECIERGNTPEACTGLAKAVAEVRSSREGEEAKKADADARKAQSQATLATIVAVSLAAVAAGGAAVYAAGGPAAAMAKIKGALR